MAILARNEALVLSEDILADRRTSQLETVPDRVMFRPTALYGLSKESVDLPISEVDSVESGQICITTDPDSESGSNLGIIDFEKGKIHVRYGIQCVFPGLVELIARKQFDPSLLNPVRALATDECTMTDDQTGFRAMGCLEILPGSVWAGTEGG